MERDPDCTRCSLSKDASTVCIWGEPQGKKPDIFLIGEAPGELEDSKGRPFIGQSGQLLRTVLDELGIIERCYITNSVKCRPPGNRQPGTEELKQCSGYLAAELRARRPKVIVCLGATAIRALTGEKAPVGEKRKLRNWIHEETGARIVATYHPAAILREPSRTTDFIDDLVRARDGSVDPGQEEVRWEYVKNVSKLPRILAFDIETTGLNPFATNAHILSIAWSDGKRTRVTRDVFGFCTAVKNCTIIGHNVKFDLLWLAVTEGYFHNGHVYDTKQIAHLTNENRESFGLKVLAQQYTNLGDYAAKIDRAKTYELSEEELFRYNATDALATWQLFQALKKEAQAERVWHLAGWGGLLTKSLVRIEYAGMQVSPAGVAEVQKHLRRKRTLLLKKITGVPGWDGVNLDSPKQLSKHLYETLRLPVQERTSKGAPSTSEAALLKLPQSPVLKWLLEYRGVKKLLSTYIEDLLEKCDSKSRVHPSYNPTGTVTGRLSCSAPNLQNIPRGDVVKSVFGVADGNILVQADYSQIELRIGAHLSQDPIMLEIMRSGGDLHWTTARAIWGEKATKDDRSRAKTVNFGIFYGMGPYALAEKTGLTFHQAGRMIHSWFDLYPGVKRWLEQQQELLLDQGYVTSIFGRKRRLPPFATGDKEARARMLRQACNFPVQSSAGELTLAAMDELSHHWRVVGTVHDSILIETEQQYLTQCCSVIHLTMENTLELLRPFGVKHGISVPCPVEISYGPTWADMKEEN